MLAEQESVARLPRVRGTVALVVALAVALVHISGPGVAPTAAQSVMEGGAGSIEADPQPGPFYHADPQHLADAPLGEVINSRDVTMPAFLGYRVTEISYRPIPDSDARVNALLAGELALARWLLYGVRSGDPAVVADAVQMLEELDAHTRTPETEPSLA